MDSGRVNSLYTLYIETANGVGLEASKTSLVLELLNGIVAEDTETVTPESGDPDALPVDKAAINTSDKRGSAFRTVCRKAEPLSLITSGLRQALFAGPTISHGSMMWKGGIASRSVT